MLSTSTPYFSRVVPASSCSMVLWKVGLLAAVTLGLAVCSADPQKEKRQLDFGGPPPSRQAAGGRGRGTSNLSGFQPGGGGQQFRPQAQDDFDDDRPSFRQPHRGGASGANAVEEEEAEQKKPDRLQTLLQNTKFECSAKKTGYYADNTLECEVFHYCSEGVRHSWMCPEGQVFHQIHLICMPKSAENICTQSEKFHFVNDYLYKPVNEGKDNNGTLRYHDRFFPEGYVHGGNLGDFDDQDQPPQRVPQRRPPQHFSGDDDFSGPPPQRQKFSPPPQRVPAKIPVEDLEEDEEDFPPPRTAPRLPLGVPPSNPGGRPRFSPQSGANGFSAPPSGAEQGGFRPSFQEFSGGPPPSAFGGGSGGPPPRFVGGGGGAPSSFGGGRSQFAPNSRSQFSPSQSSKSSSESGDDSRGFAPFRGFQ